MFGLNTEIHSLRDELQKTKEQLRDLKTLAKLAVENPDNLVAREALRIAVKNIES